MGTLVGYMRVSSFDQNKDRQQDGLSSAGVSKIFEDDITGLIIDRPGLNALKAYVREGDTVVILSMDRLARNLIEFRKCINDFNAKGVSVKFIKENITITGDDSPMSILFLSMMGAFAEFERAFIRERQREGIALAKARGAFKGGVRKLGQADRDYLYDAIDRGVPKTEIAKRLKITRGTVYSYIGLKKALMLD
jgi:DNA invertase Pin-like site-specific DNA recombinase